MNGISHNQAIKWIHRRQDGMLSESQLSILEEHIGSCDSCRTYAEEMDLLASRLHHEFQARWDPNPGPSQHIIQRLTANAKRIPMTNRFSSSLRVLGGVTALIVLGLSINFFISQFRYSSPITSATEAVDISPPAEDRLLAFTSDQSGNFEIYIMYPDGRGLTNITNHPASDTYPFWSPDGRRIAFTSDRGGSHQLYLMDADGSNVVQLTDGEGSYWFDVNRYTPWSPDGRKLIFSHKLPGEQSYKLYVMDLSDQTITALTKDAGQYLLPSWSPGGEYIAFAADTGGTSRDLFIIGSDGTRLIKLTENLRGGEYFINDYHWSPNGETLIFTTGANVYAAGPDGSLAVMSTADRQILDWWDGTAILDNHEGALTWLRPDGSQSTLDLCQNGRLLGIAHRRSHGGNLVVGSNCSGSGLMFYWANPDGTVAHPLLNAPISWEADVLFNLTWSPDDHYLAFVGLDTASPDVAETLYVLDVAKAREDPSIQPLKMENSSGLSWQPIHVARAVENSADLKIDPQGCKPASELDLASQPPSELRGYDLVQGAAVVDGDFSYEFWLYCDPALKPDDQENFSAIAGLGIYSSWRYDGPQVEGENKYYYEFEPNIPLGRTDWDGPLDKISVNGTRFGIAISEATARVYIQQEIPVQLHVLVSSALGQKGATLSFNLEPSEQGVKVVDLRAERFDPLAEGLIAFTAAIEDGNLDIYTMRPDGSELTNLTGNPAHDTNPVWSPDGRRIVFESDRSGFIQIYSMDADGSNVIRLTAGESDYRVEGFNPWSPDGKKLVFMKLNASQVNEGKWMKLYVLDVETKTQTPLTSEWGFYQNPAWSPDGEHVAFTSLVVSEQGEPDQVSIRMANADGSSLVDLTESLPDYLSPVLRTWSRDGQSIFFFAQGSVSYIVYEARLDGSLIEHVSGFGGKLLDWWNGITLLQESSERQAITWFHDGTFSSLDICFTENQGMNISYTRSSNEHLFFGIQCSPGAWSLYMSNKDGSTVQTLMDSPLYAGDGVMVDQAWSPDDNYIAFKISSGSGKVEMFILDVAGTLNDPTLEPVRFDIGDIHSSVNSFSWQPIP